MIRDLPARQVRQRLRTAPSAARRHITARGRMIGRSRFGCLCRMNGHLRAAIVDDKADNPDSPARKAVRIFSGCAEGAADARGRIRKEGIEALTCP